VNTWKSKEFEKCLTKVVYSNNIQQFDFKNTGMFPIISQNAEFISGFWDDEKDVFKISKPVVIFGDHTRCLKYVDFDFVLGADGVKILQTIDEILPKYLYYYLQYIPIENLGYSRHYKLLKEKTIKYPSIDQQQKIVDILDKADEIRTKKRLANDKLDEFLKSTFISMFGDPKVNTKHLPIFKIIDLCIVQTGSTPKRDVEDYYRDATIPWVKTGEVINQYIYGSEEHISEKAIKETNCKLFPVNTILLAMYGQGLTRGRVGMLKIEASTNQACSAILPSDKINHEFLYNQLKIQYQTLRDYGRGGNQPNLNMDIVKKFEVICPPIEEQNKFAQIVEKVETQKQKNEQVIEQMDNLFNSLSQKAFKGEL
jgi:type I restriction enzyme S subunit